MFSLNTTFITVCLRNIITDALLRSKMFAQYTRYNSSWVERWSSLETIKKPNIIKRLAEVQSFVQHTRCKFFLIGKILLVEKKKIKKRSIIECLVEIQNLAQYTKVHMQIHPGWRNRLSSLAKNKWCHDEFQRSLPFRIGLKSVVDSWVSSGQVETTDGRYSP